MPLGALYRPWPWHYGCFRHAVAFAIVKLRGVEKNELTVCGIFVRRTCTEVYEQFFVVIGLKVTLPGETAVARFVPDIGISTRVS